MSLIERILQLGMTNCLGGEEDTKILRLEHECDENELSTFER